MSSKKSLLDTVALVAYIVSVVVYAYVVMFGDYSGVRFIYLVSVFLFVVAGDLYIEVGRKISAIAMFILSSLVALKLVF